MEFDESKAILGKQNKPSKTEDKPSDDSKKFDEEIEVSRPAYKTKKFANEAGMNRFFKVKNCKECNAKPPLEPLKLKGYEGMKCSKCFEVIKYEKTI